jgi:FKBP-type peptidyl-prolyl cis-trans isomerase 2
MIMQKKDFIEVEFTGKVKDGGIFDSNIKEDLKKLNPDETPKPLIFCLGEGMFLKGIDDFLIGKEIGSYTIELTPEKAFGPRIAEMVQMIPSKIFREQRLNPMPGVVFNFDGRLAKVLSVSGGRIMVDFNHPLAGKIVIYDVRVLRKIDDLNERVKAFIDFLFRREMKFSVKDKKVIIEVEKNISKFVEMFKDKFKEVLELDLEIKEIDNPAKEAQ